MADSRAKNSKRNIISGIIMQAFNILLPFATRTIILYYLGVEYQGLNNLFISILQVLNLADLGFSSAVIFALYKPVADGDNELISGIINFLKKVYYVVGAAILVAGLVLMPFLPKLINSGIPDDINIYIVFAIFLGNTVISYWLFAYKSALFIAMQRKDVTNNILTITNLLTRAMQIVVLVVFKDFYLYSVCLPVGTIINNVLLQILSKKYFPDISPRGKPDIETKNLLKKQIKAICVDKICDASRNSFDNIAISLFIGLAAVAIYSNYYYVYSSLYGVMLVINSAMQASVGNSIAKESKDKTRKDLTKINFITMWIVGVLSICTLCLYQDFMMIWMKNNTDMLLPFTCMILFVIYFYFINSNNVRNLYLEGAGLFWKCRYWYLIEAGSNFLLNFLLGYFFGMYGILIATIFSILVFNFIARSQVLFRNYFDTGLKDFYLQHAIYLIVTCLAATGMYFLSSLIVLDNKILQFFAKGSVCFLTSNVIFLLVYFKTSLFKESFQFGLKFFKRGNN